MEKSKEILSVNLTKLRGKKSQRQVAEDAGLSLRQYSRYEAAESWPTEETLESLADALGVSADVLIKKPKAESDNSSAPLTTKADLLTSLYSVAPTLPEDKLREVVELALRHSR